MMDQVKRCVSETLESIQRKPWSTPLGKTLETTGDIVKELGPLFPGLPLLGMALKFGGNLLVLTPAIADLHGKLKVTQEKLDARGNREEVMRKLMREKKEIQHKIANPENEIRTDIASVRKDMKEMFKTVVDSSGQIEGEISLMKDRIGQTFHLVADTRYKVS